MDLFNSEFILNEKRWLWIDYDKGISIILVAFGHCLFVLQGHGIDLSAFPFFNYIGTFLYGFRMPLFFIVSGLLVGRSLNKKGLNNYISDRANNILYPLLVWGFIEITLEVITSRYTPFSNTTPTSPYKYLQLLTDPRDTGHFWYLNTLFCIGVIYAFMRAVARVKPALQVLLGLVLFSVSAYIHIHDISAGFLTDVCEYYFFFALGDLVSNVMLSEKSTQILSSWKLFFPMLCLFLTIQYFFTQINLRPTAEGINFVEHKMPFFFLLEALVGCAMSVNVSFLLQRYKVSSWIRVVGYHSLFIYCMQIIVMDFSRIILTRILHISYVPALVLLIWVAGIALPIIFYNFCLKYRLWWLYTYRKPEREVAHIRTSNVFSFARRRPVRHNPL